MELSETHAGKRHVFSLAFITKKGEYVYLPHAFTSGLRANMKDNRLRGITPCTADGKAIGHPYPVQIDNILKYNGQTITL